MRNVIDPSFCLPIAQALLRRVRFTLDSPRHDVALTFDDGPDHTHTPPLLDVLERERVGATFFWLADSLARAPDLAIQIHRAGHQIALHGDRHVPFVIRRPTDVKAGLYALRNRIASVTGLEPDRICHVRPPFGLITPRWASLLIEWGYQAVLCSILPGDWNSAAEIVVRRVNRRLKAGAIIALHDGPDNGQNAAKIAQTLIGEIRARGLSATTLDP
jgi:peptidoglycan/xylan/chitin deacetylase (PgdA/CDA1 family)